MSMPLVSCVLPVANPQRIGLARKAINGFIRQHYLPYELLVVNSTGQQILTNDSMATEEMVRAGCQVRELEAVPGLPASGMKNIGLASAKGDWVICVDDDDYFHPTRLMYQMAHRNLDCPVLLQCQLRVDISSAVRPPVLSGAAEFAGFKPLLHLLQEEQGVASTMLFPRVDVVTGQAWFFDAQLVTHEADELLTRFGQAGKSVVVCRNMHSPFVQGLHWPLLSVAVYHGDNVLSREQFFVSSVAQPEVVPVGLNQVDIAQLKVVLQTYNFTVQE